MNRFAPIVILVLCVILIRYAVSQEKTKPETSPHGEALNLVLSTQQKTIRDVDKENWWHDTVTREWSVKRPFAPGVYDSTHWFDVSYKIGGKEVASWFVDTSKKQVKRPAIGR